MKTKNLLRNILALIPFLFIVSAAIGQAGWDTMSYKQFADFKLQQLNKSFINSGILYDRIFPVADIERFKQQNQTTDTSGPRHWIQAYYELYNASYNNTSWLSPDVLDRKLDTNAFVNAVPIGLLNFKYNVLDTNAYVDNLIDTLPNGQFTDVSGRPRNPYFDRSTFIASPIIADDIIFTEGDSCTFYLDPQFFLYNEYIDIKQIRIDFGDEQGEWIVNNPFSMDSATRGNFIVKAIKKLIGRTLVGRVIVVGIDVGGHWIEYGNPFKILARKKKDEYPLTACKGGKGGGAKWAIDPDPSKLAPINAQYGNPPAVHNQIVRTGPGLFDFTIEPVKDTAYFFFNDDGNNCTNRIVKRPVIFIDGFDPSNDRKVGDIYKDFINVQVDRTINGTSQRVRFGDYMLDNGNPNDDLDLIILDFKHGNDLLERNAMALVALIERLNETYGAAYEQDITLIGPSMGSLIAQYALAYMEHNNISHRVKTYISFDGCHQGANVPIGLQYFVEYITKRGILKNVESIREGLYNGLAAKQMLAHHHSSKSLFPVPDALRAQFLQNLAIVGEYPQLCRKVAIINGANNGTINPNFGSNEEMLDIEIKRKGWKSLWGLCEANICKKIKWIARTATNSGTNTTAEMWTASPLYNILFWVPLGKKTYQTQAAWNNSSLDNAPGGLIGNKFSPDLETHGTFLAKELIYLLTGDKPSFDININNFTMMPSYSSADLRFPTKDLYLNWREKDLCGYTPFDYVYAPTSNEEHVFVSEEGSKWFESEVRCNVSDLPVLVDPNIHGNNIFCTSGNYSIVFCQTSNHTVNWTVSDPSIAYITGSGDQITLNRIKNGIITLTATVQYSCSGFSSLDQVLTKQVIVGQPKPGVLSWVWDLPPKRVTLSVDDVPEATTYQWYLNGVLKATTSVPYYALLMKGNVSCGNAYYFGVKAVGICGASEESYVYAEMPSCSFGYRISPNPATNNISIQSLEETENSKIQKVPGIRKVEIYDKMGALKLSRNFSSLQSATNISVVSIPADVYTLRIFDGQVWQSCKIMVQH